MDEILLSREFIPSSAPLCLIHLCPLSTTQSANPGVICHAKDIFYTVSQCIRQLRPTEDLSSVSCSALNEKMLVKRQKGAQKPLWH